MNITLSEILDLVGKLDDSPGDDTGRERFRRYLGKNLLAPGQIRDYGLIRNQELPSSNR